MKGCSKSDAIWASFMGSFAILGGSSPPIPTPILQQEVIDYFLLCYHYSKSV